MTVDTIERLKDLVDEVQGTSNQIVSAWEYVNVYSDNVCFCAFTVSCVCDVFDSPAVKQPILIYRRGRWLKQYDYLNYQ